MRTEFLLIGFAWGALLRAQPGAELFFMEPCGLLPYHEVDITGDSIPDLIITGRSEGTDDVPSSSGHCSRVVQCATGTQLLSENDGAGPDIPAQFGAHGTLVRIILEEDRYLPARHWFPGELVASHWAYGGAARGVQAPQPELRNTIFIARVRTLDADTLIAFEIDVDPSTQNVSIQVIATAPDGSDLVW